MQKDEEAWWQKKEEAWCKSSPCSLLHFALGAWINGRKGWDPELGLHLCKVSKRINDIVLDCDFKTIYGGRLYSYNNLQEIIEWEKKRQGGIKSRRQRYWATLKRAMITANLQDEIEMDEYPYKKNCRRLFTE